MSQKQITEPEYSVSEVNCWWFRVYFVRWWSFKNRT